MPYGQLILALGWLSIASERGDARSADGLALLPIGLGGGPLIG